MTHRTRITSLFFMTALLFADTCRFSEPITITNIYGGGTVFEGPHWAQDENSLYWVDQLQQKIFRLDGYTGNISTRQVEYGPVSLVVRVKDYVQLVLVTVRSEVYLLPWNGTAGDSDLRLLSVVDLGMPDNRCNDGKVDAKGRLWFGTFGKIISARDALVEGDRGSLYVLNQHNYVEPNVKVRPVSLSNGIAWSSDNTLMFYIDTSTKNVDVFDFVLSNGTIGNRRTIFSFQANNLVGFPDGMTIDTDDNLWVACNGGGKVLIIDSRTGMLLDQLILPVTQVTSVTWGGPDLSTLYVTSANDELTTAELAQQPEAGSLFAIEGTGSRGFSSNQFVFKNADIY